jgi:uroporphyrinogen-III synthase
MLAAAINAAGGVATPMPLLAIEPLPALAAADKQKVLDLDLYQHVLFVSTNAVQCGHHWIDQFWPQLPTGIAWHAIGRATAEAMTDSDIPVTSAGELAMNSEELLAGPALQQVAGQRVLIVRAVGGREHLASSLRERGAQVDYLPCYQRQLPTYAAGTLATTLSGEQIDAVCLNSGETLMHYLTLLAEQREHFQRLPVVVPSERVQALAQAEGLQRVVLANNAGNEATLNALASLAR